MEKMISQLQYSSQHFRSLMNSCNVGVIVTNSVGYICDMNQHAFTLLGLDKSDCLGYHFFDILDFSLNPQGSISLSENMKNQTLIVKTKKYKKEKFVFSIEIVSPIGSTSYETIITFFPSDLKKDAKSDVSVSNGFDAKYTFDSIIKTSYCMREVERIGKIAAKTSSNVLIYGESGTGKELIAQSIHNESDRRNGPFVALNCGAIPEGLIESELFGYEGGTFTGARATGQAGKFEMASGGTIFLDEIADMPLNLQVILLRVLQSREILRLGGKSPKKVDVRVIAATNANLKECIANKTFRNDLYYRLNVFGINVPPLRERKEDIKILAKHFIGLVNEREGTNVYDLDSTVMDMFMEYNWPGNIRELENIIEWSVNMAAEPIIHVRDLPMDFVQPFLSDATPATVQSPTKSKEEADPELKYEILVSTLKSLKGNVNKASTILGIGRRSLYRKFEEYDINPANFRK